MRQITARPARALAALVLLAGCSGWPGPFATMTAPDAAPAPAAIAAPPDATPVVARAAADTTPATPAPPPRLAEGEPPLYPNETPELRALINKWADHYEIPRELVHRQAVRESTHRPWARNGPYWGLLQILPQTARTMGHRGPPEELLDPDINLKYAVKYLRGAYLVAGGDLDAAMKWYARGYYYEAKRLGLLYETGLRS